MDSNRYRCMFRDKGRDFFVTDCAFPDKDQAARYVTRITKSLKTVAEGRVFDFRTKKTIFTKTNERSD